VLEIQHEEPGLIRFTGRLDASQADKARQALDRLQGSCTIDLEALRYISSAGISVLLITQKRLNETGHGLKLIKLNPHVGEIFKIAGLEIVFEIE